MRKNILLICLMALVNFSYGKNKILIPAIEILDSTYYCILDSVLKLDSDCDYFSDTLSYSVFISDTTYNSLPFYYFTFEGNSDLSFYFSIVGNYLGCIKYNNHYFFIHNKCHLPKDKLVVTDKNYSFDSTFIGKYPLSEDDSWAIRYLGFYNGIIYYLGSINDDIQCK